MRKNEKIQKILLILFSIILYIILTSYHSWTKIIEYYISYIHHKNDYFSLTINSGKYITPTIRLLYSFFYIFGIIITKLTNIKLICMISILLINISLFFLIYSTTKSLIIILFLIYSIGLGISYMPILLNIWFYFQDKKGVMLGLLSLSTAIGHYLFRSIGLFFLNKLENKNLNKNNNSYYELNNYKDIEVFMKMQFYIVFILSISFVIILFLWKPDKYIQNKNIKKKKKFLLNSYKNYYELQDYDNYQNFDNHKYLNFKNDYKDDESYTNLFDNKIEDIFLTFKSKPFIQLCFVYNLSYLFNTLHLTDFPYLKNENNKNITNYFNIVWYITNIIFRFFWGSFLDFYDFKNLYLITLFLQIGTYSTFFLITKYQFIVFIYSFFNSLANSAIYTIMPYGFYLIFGWTNFGILYSINNFISMILEYYIIFLIEKLKKNNLNFLILCYLSSFCSIMSFIILCFVEIKKFDYYKHSNENAIKKKFRYNKEHNDSDSDN